jgi:hypothetical protein
VDVSRRILHLVRATAHAGALGAQPGDTVVTVQGAEFHWEGRRVAPRELVAMLLDYDAVLVW